MKDVVNRAIKALERRTLDPKAKHPDNEAAFILARYLQGENIPFNDSTPYVDEYYRISNEKELLMYSDGEEIDRFTFDTQLKGSWSKIKVQIGTIYKLAIKQAKVNGIPEKAKVIPDKDAQFLASVCRELQKCHRQKPFYLSQTDAGDIIGKGRRAGAARLLALIQYGIIKLHTKGHTNLASEYFFIADVS